MRKKIDSMFLKAKLRIARCYEAFIQEQKGASDMVAIILLIVVVIAVAITFRSAVGDAMGNAMSQLKDFVGE